MLQKINSNFNLKFRNEVLGILKYKKIISDDFFDLERLHEHISPDMCIDQDWPSGRPSFSSIFFDQDISNIYDNFIYSIYEILGYDFYFQKIPTIRVHCPEENIDDDFRFWHNDTDFGHPPEELNIWISLTENKECSFEILDSEDNIKEVNSNLDSFLFFDDGSNDVVKHSYRPVINETRVSIETRINPKEKYVSGYVGTGRMKAEFKPGGCFGYDKKLASEIFNEV